MIYGHMALTPTACLSTTQQYVCSKMFVSFGENDYGTMQRRYGYPNHQQSYFNKWKKVTVTTSRSPTARNQFESGVWNMSDDCMKELEGYYSKPKPLRFAVSFLIFAFVSCRYSNDYKNQLHI